MEGYPYAAFPNFPTTIPVIQAAMAQQPQLPPQPQQAPTSVKAPPQQQMPQQPQPQQMPQSQPMMQPQPQPMHMMPTLDQIHHQQQMQLQHQQQLQQQQMQLQQQQQQSSEGWVTRLMSRRREFVKLITLALMIVIALAVHELVLSLLRRTEDSTEAVQLGVRLLYVMGGIVLLWLLKAFN